MEAIERLAKARELLKALQDLKITEDEYVVIDLVVTALFPNFTIRPRNDQGFLSRSMMPLVKNSNKESIFEGSFSFVGISFNLPDVIRGTVS